MAPSRSTVRRRRLIAALIAGTMAAALQANCVGNDPASADKLAAPDASSSDAIANDAASTDGPANDASSDAAADAAPRGVGSVTATGFIITSSAPGTTCIEQGPAIETSSMLCAPSSTDCCFNVGNSDCVPTNTGSCAIRFACDGPEDCAPGANCRGTGAGANTACGPGFQSRDRCHESVQCPGGYVCCQAKIVSEDGGYVEAPTPGDTRYSAYTNGVCLATTDDLDPWRCDQ